MSLDHSYSQTSLSNIESFREGTSGGSARKPTASSPIKSHPPLEDLSEREVVRLNDSISSNDTQAPDVDDLYDPEKTIDSESEDDDTSFNEVAKYVDEQKIIVFESCLDRLFVLMRCPVSGCCEPFSFDEIDRNTRGGMQYTCTFVCMKGHRFVWSAQPSIHSMSVGNILSAAATLFCGQTFTHIAQYASFFGLNFYSDSTFYKIQRELLKPVVFEAWSSLQGEILQQLKRDNVPLRLSGDGRCDSPGYCAKYCTYTLMDMNTSAIVCFVVVDVKTAGNSARMELAGFRLCVEFILSKGFKIEVIATDRHTQIRSEMKKSELLAETDHQFDVWHIAKSIKKKLVQAAKTSGNEDLMPWISAIQNHLWWSAANCDQNPDKLQEMWQSTIYHIANEHEFEGNHFTECAHEPLSQEQTRKKKWLTIQSSAHEALKSVINDSRLTTDIGFLSQFCHTGALEVYHSLMTKYVPKRQAFDSAGMDVRTRLAALDHNYSLGRQQIINKTTGEKRFKLVYPKASAKWVVKPTYEDKSYEWVYNLMKSVLDFRERQRDENVATETCAPPKGNIAPVPAPTKAEAIAKHMSRFPSTSSNDKT